MTTPVEFPRVQRTLSNSSSTIHRTISVHGGSSVRGPPATDLPKTDPDEISSAKRELGKVRRGLARITGDSTQRSNISLSRRNISNSNSSNNNNNNNKNKNNKNNNHHNHNQEEEEEEDNDEYLLLKETAMDNACRFVRVEEGRLRKKLIDLYEPYYDAEEDVIIDGAVRMAAISGSSKSGKKILDRILRQQRLHIYRRIDVIIAEKKINEWNLENVYKKELKKLIDKRKERKSREVRKRLEEDRNRRKGIAQHRSRAHTSALTNSSNINTSNSHGNNDQQLLFPGVAEEDEDNTNDGDRNDNSNLDTPALVFQIDELSSNVPNEDEKISKRRKAKETAERDPLHVDFTTMSTTLVPNMIVSISGPLTKKKSVSMQNTPSVLSGSLKELVRNISSSVHSPSARRN